MINNRIVAIEGLGLKLLIGKFLLWIFWEKSQKYWYQVTKMATQHMIFHSFSL